MFGMRRFRLLLVQGQDLRVQQVLDQSPKVSHGSGIIDEQSTTGRCHEPQRDGRNDT
jgi:hypothetical protein